MTIEASKTNAEDLELENILLEDIALESRFVNVLQRSSDALYEDLIKGWGSGKCIENGYRPRTNHEVYNGLAYVQKIGVPLDSEVVNLPFTVLNIRNKPAETAFTERHPDRRKIFLVPDHTATRILKDVAVHKAGFDGLIASKSISKDLYERAMNQMTKLNIAARVGASIIHEQGHILSYRAMDKLGITKTQEVYIWLDELGYIDNCSKRIVSFTDKDALSKLNIALEQLAEDYRVSHYIRDGYPLPSLPHSISYIQDVTNPETFLEGVEIMSRLLTIDKKRSNFKRKDGETGLDLIIPYGEGDRSIAAQFAKGNPTPITKDVKQRDLEFLREFDSTF